MITVRERKNTLKINVGKSSASVPGTRAQQKIRSPRNESNKKRKKKKPRRRKKNKKTNQKREGNKKTQKKN